MANDFPGAAAWCEAQEIMQSASADEVRTIAVGEYAKPHEQEQVAQEYERGAAHATLALSCVRAMQALAEGRVTLQAPTFSGGEWIAWNGRMFTAPDPLTAITMALTEAGDA